MALTGGFSADFPRWSREQMFHLASDIEAYPRFIPWCKAATIVSEAGQHREVDNHYGAGPVDLAFRSEAVAIPPERLEITSTTGPFRRFRLVWTFIARPEGGCRVGAEYVVDFRSPLVQGLARLTLREVERRVVARFRDRARELFG